MSKPSHRKRHFRDDVDAEDFRAACQMYRDGHGVDTIGAQLRRDPEIVEAWVAGVQRGARHWRAGSNDEMRAAREFASKGVNVMEIAELLNRPPSTIEYWISHPDKASVIPREPDPRIAEAKRLREEDGKTHEQIAAALGCSASTAARLLQRANGYL